MFFIGGINPRTKQLDFRQTLTCPYCGRYSSISIHKQYQQFSLYFIPLFRWSKRYYVETSCCGRVAEISEDIGKAVEHGESITIQPEDITVNEIYSTSYCKNCNAFLSEAFEYCPKCGQKRA